VEDLVVMQRHLASREFDIDRGGFIDVDGDLLSAGEHRALLRLRRNAPAQHGQFVEIQASFIK